MAAKKAKSERDGRPPLLTPEVQAAVVASISGGNFRNVAAERNGIKVRTLNHWMRLGKVQTSGIYYNFSVAVLEAEAQAEESGVKKVYEDDDPKSLMWWLERKFPERWGKDRDLLREMMKRIRELEARTGVAPAKSEEKT